MLSLMFVLNTPLPRSAPVRDSLLLLVGNGLHGLLVLFVEARYCVTTGVHGHPCLLPCLNTGGQLKIVLC